MAGIRPLRRGQSKRFIQHRLGHRQGAVAGGDEVLPYAELSKRLGRSEGALRTAATRLRTRWRERLREVVAETVGDESEIEDELKSLITFVGGSV